jgi:hypothetical protein
MKILITTLLLAASLFAQSVPTAAQLVGTWKIVSIEDTMADGKVQPSAQFGPHPHGFLMYEPDGYMCATLVNGDRPAWTDAAHPTNQEKIAYFDTLIAYCGTYKLDTATSTVTHYPEVAWTPSYVRSTQPRPFRIEGNHLIITVTRGISDPSIKQRILVWERANK